MPNSAAGSGGPPRCGYGLLLLLLSLFNLIDYRLTNRAIIAGGTELNPFAAALIERGCFGLYKIGLIPAGLLFLWLARRHLTRFALVLLWGTFAAYAALMAYYARALLAGQL